MAFMSHFFVRKLPAPKIMMSIFPKDDVFYKLFEAQTEKLAHAARILREMLENPKNIEDQSARMKILENEADDIGHKIMNTLRHNFITPMEGEDINLLRQTLDDIMDLIEKAVNRIVIYKIAIPFPQAVCEYIGIIKKSIEEVEGGVKEMRNVRKFQESLARRCQRLNLLENEGDEINRRALKSLMNVPSPTPAGNLEIIKLKEIYETLENAIDSCENVGNIFESIIIKNA